MSILSLHNLCLRIGETPILRDVCLKVQPGEILAITGESGSGKSMTALSIMGLLPRKSELSGQIILDGQDIVQTKEEDLCNLRGHVMGMVFQEPMTALNPVKTIGEQVAETIKIHQNVSRKEALDRAAIVLKKVGLNVEPTRYPHELSGGQRQRVVIAMAIALKPKVLIADEPTTALDVTTQSKILKLLQELVREFDMALVMITHDLAVVAEMADTIAVMQNGKIVETDKTSKLLQNMQHPYTKKLFKASSHKVTLPPYRATADLLGVEQIERSYPLARKQIFGPRQRFKALENVSFQIAQGERLGLVGESGCGKSTLTRAILGLEEIQSGQILLNGRPVCKNGIPNADIRDKMQVVFQDPYSSFNPRHRVDRLISEPLHILSQKPPAAQIQEWVEKALEDVGLRPSDGQKYIHEFSGGQRQRIAIARALIVAPELIIFDEAVSALDVSIRSQILDLIADLCHKRPLAYLFISHDLSVVRTITDRVMVMQTGKIVEQGLTEDVFQNPQHPYTKELILAAPRALCANTGL